MNASRGQSGRPLSASKGNYYPTENVSMYSFLAEKFRPSHLGKHMLPQSMNFPNSPSTCCTCKPMSDTFTIQAEPCCTYPEKPKHFRIFLPDGFFFPPRLRVLLCTYPLCHPTRSFLADRRYHHRLKSRTFLSAVTRPLLQLALLLWKLF